MCELIYISHHKIWTEEEEEEDEEEEEEEEEEEDSTIRYYVCISTCKRKF